MNSLRYMLCVSVGIVGFSLSAMAIETNQNDVSSLQKKADDGDAEAQTNLAVLYHNGQGVQKDEVKAKEYYTKAAKQGYARAQYNLGIMYHEGEGMAQNYKKAKKWFIKAANQNYANAQFNLGVMHQEGQSVPKDNIKAKEWFQKACSNNLKLGCDFAKKL